MRVAYVGRQDGTDMRISKECNSLLQAGHDVTFLGWDRAPGEVRPDPMPDVSKRLYKRAVRYGPREVAAAYPGYIWHVGRELRSLRPDVVHCVNEDLVLVVFPLKRILGFSVVADIFDSIALRWSNARAPLPAIARVLARLAHSGSDAIIVTDEARRDRLGRPADVVANFPVDPGKGLALQLPDGNAPTRLYVSGHLTAARGLGVITELLEKSDAVQVVCAGWPCDDVARDFIAHPKVRFLGTIAPAESLRQAASCHAIVALYDPCNENNILASPNKVYDALCVGRPLIINREARVAQWVAEMNMGYTVAYGDVSQTLHTVQQISQERSELEATAVRLRALFEQGYSWSTSERSLLDVYDRIASRIACPVAAAGTV